MAAVQAQCLLEAGFGLWIGAQGPENRSRLHQGIHALGVQLNAAIVCLP